VVPTIPRAFKRSFAATERITATVSARAYVACVIPVLVALLTASARATEVANRHGGLYAGAAPVSMVSSRVDTRVTGILVESVVTQRFRNDLKTPIEAVYIFPLPVGAIVTGAQLRVDGVITRAGLTDRAQARASYERAVAAGTIASLMEQERSDVFTMAVTAIAPGATVDVVVTWDGVVERSTAGWQLRLPLVVAPKQKAGQANGRPTLGTGRLPDTARAPDASRISPLTSPEAGIATTLNIEFSAPVQNLQCASHDEAIDPDAQHVRITVAQSNRDVIVEWQQTISTRPWVEQSVDGSYAAMVVEQAPSASAKATSAMKLAIMFDRWSTTSGSDAALARIVLQQLISKLPAAGKQQIAFINSTTTVRWLSIEQASAAIVSGELFTSKTKDITAEFRSVRATGAEAVVFVSNGQYANDAEIIEAGKRVGVPIYTVAVGAAPAHGLLRTLAQQSAGTARQFNHIDESSELVAHMIDDISQPARPLLVSWGNLPTVEQTPSVLPRLGVGQSMVISARLSRAVPASVADVRAAGRAISPSLTRHSQLARQWARSRLREMNVYAPEAVEFAKRYGLLTEATALVAVTDIKTAPGGTRNSVAIPVDLKAGERTDGDDDESREQPVSDGTTDVRATTNGAPSPPPVQKVPVDKELSGDSDTDGVYESPRSFASSESADGILLAGYSPRSRWIWRVGAGVGLSARNDDRTQTSQLSAALSAQLGADRWFTPRFAIGAEVGVALRTPGTDIVLRPMLNINYRATRYLSFAARAGGQWAPAQTSVDARAFAFSIDAIVELSMLHLPRWQFWWRNDAAFASNGSSYSPTLGLSWRW
jgi:Ca-activated chloride channel homolog